MKLSLTACFALLITVSPGFGLTEEMINEFIVQESCDALNSSQPDLPMTSILEKYPILKNDTDSCKKRLTDYPKYSICINETWIFCNATSDHAETKLLKLYASEEPIEIRCELQDNL